MRFFVGKFGVSDHIAALNVSAFVEVENGFSAPLVFVALDPYKEQGISIKFNSIELRAFAFGLKAVASSKEQYEYTKTSGGSGTKSELKVYSNDKYDYVGISKGAFKSQVSFKAYELLALSQELLLLCDETMKSLYKTQQFILKKKSKEEKKIKEKEKENR